MQILSFAHSEHSYMPNLSALKQSFFEFSSLILLQGTKKPQNLKTKTKIWH